MNTENGQLRKASVEAAKKWVKKRLNCDCPVCTSILADIIQSHLAPVVATAAEGAPCHPASCRDEMLWRETMAKEVAVAEEAMKEKCADTVHIKAIAYKEKAQSFHEAGNSVARDTHQAFEYLLYELARELRAIPTGTALAEYVERDVAAARDKCEPAKPLTVGSGERLIDKMEQCVGRAAKLVLLRNFVERATAELRAENAKLEGRLYGGTGWEK